MLNWKRGLTGLLAGAMCTLASAQLTIDFSSSQGTGTAQDKVLIENIRVYVPQGSGAPVELNYNVLFQFDPSTLHLVPLTLLPTGGANNCANATVNVYNALTGPSGPIAGATVFAGTRSATTNSSGAATFTGLPSGLTSITVVAGGYSSATQVYNMSCATVNSPAVALSPGSGQSGGLSTGQFRAILTWGQNPSDLDSHLTGPSPDGSRWHVYYSSPSAGGICNLDVDDVSAYGPETMTCPATTGATSGLVDGVYRYSVHHYSGSSNISDSGATVRLELGNGTTYSYTPPAGATLDDDVWTVFEITVSGGSVVAVTPVNSIQHGVSPGSVQSVPRPRFGQPEDASLFRGRK